MKKKLHLLIMAVLSVLLFVSCGGEKETKSGKGEVRDTLIVANGADAKSLDPHATNDAPSSKVTVQIYDRLVDQDDNMNVVPALAESWEQPDGVTTIFHLRKGVKFHNGEPLTAKDVKFSLDRMKSSPQVSHIIGILDRVEIVDDYTVKVITKQPFGALLSHLSHPTAAILNEKAVKEYGDSYGQHPVGTGPYKFISWASGDRIILEANPDYFMGETPIKNVIIRAISEATNRTIGLETGEIDIAYDLEGMDKDRVREDKNLVFLEEPSLGIDYIGFNTAKAPFNDVRVRQAIAMTIKVDDIIETVYKGSATRANSLIGPKVFGHTDDAKAWEVNIEKAKQLLAEAGYPNGFKSKIWINENPDRRDIAIIVQDQLRAIGVDIEVETLEWGAYLEGTSRGDHEMYILGWVSVTGDADYGLFPLLHSSCFGGAGNRAFYNNPKVDDLLLRARNSNDQEERKALYREVQIIAQEEVPYYITAFKEQNVGLQKYVENFKQRPAGHHRLYGVKFKENADK